MKSTVLFAAILLSQLAFSQNFISENKLWHVKGESWGTIYTEIFKIEGDTTINSVNYQKLWYIWDSTMNNFSLNGFLREESNVVYYLRNNYDSEGVLYDFNLETGDTTIIINEYCDDVQVIVTGTDTVEYFGIPRKRWMLDGWTDDYWIEGIGSNYGLIYSELFYCTADIYFELLCFHENDTLFYIKPYEDECYQSNVGIDEKSGESHVMIMPNPVIQGQSFVVQCNSGICKMEILSSSGVLVKQITADLEKSLSISSRGLMPGLYLVRMKTAEGQVLSRKIIIR